MYKNISFAFLGFCFMFMFMFGLGPSSSASAQDIECRVDGVVVTDAVARQTLCPRAPAPGQVTPPPGQVTPPAPPAPRFIDSSETDCREYMHEGDVECPEDQPECWRTIRAEGGRATSNPLVRTGRAHCVCLRPELETDITEGEVVISTRDGVRHRTMVRTYICHNPRMAEQAAQIGREYNDLRLRVIRLEHACGPEGMAAEHPTLADNPEWQDLCQRVDQIPEMSEDIDVLVTFVNNLDARVTRMWDVELPALAEAFCGIPADEWHGLSTETVTEDGQTRTVTRTSGLTREQILERCAASRRREDDRAAHLEHPYGVQFGAGFRGALHTETEVVAAYAVAIAQWEPMFDSTVGIYIRGRIGYGTLGDQPGNYGTVPVGESGLWGLSAGLALRVDPLVTFHLGVGYDSSLIEGMRGRVGGTYRWHTLGAEASLRFEPIAHFFIEAEVGLAWGRGRVQAPNDGELMDVDGFALPFGIIIGATF